MPDRPDRLPRPSGPPLGGDREVIYRKHRNWFQRNVSAIVAVVVVLVVIGAVVGAVLATRNVGDVAEVEPSVLQSSTAPSPTPTPSATTSPPAPAEVTEVTGPVTAVVAPGQWTVQAQQGLDLSVVTTAATTYTKGKTAEDVKKGTTISVVGTMADGVITATTVTIGKKTSS